MAINTIFLFQLTMVINNGYYRYDFVIINNDIKWMSAGDTPALF